MSSSFHRGAELDLADAVRFYRREAGAGLARRFLDEFERVLNLIEAYPDLGKPTESGRRCIPLTGFPYSVIYRHVNSGIRVLVVRHQYRDPIYSENRV